jgi:hypothetical protein
MGPGGDTRSAATRCGDIGADPTARPQAAIPEGASVSSDEWH